ncbi:hypothetical protein [Methanobacterium formicicum]|nr:hypothetical protein [Methanobacterium formicicum]
MENQVVGYWEDHPTRKLGLLITVVLEGEGKNQAKKGDFYD